MTPGRKPRVALITTNTSGGVWTVVRFLATVLERSGAYEYDLISLASSSRDESSVRIVKPSTWFTRPRIVERQLDGVVTRHVGASLTEIEFQRYRPRPVLTDLLNSYDLIQVVAGTPAWAAVATHARRPLCLFVASVVHAERATLTRRSRGWRRVYWPLINRIVAALEVQALQRADYVFAESDYTRRLIAPHVSPERLGLGLPGIDTGLFCPPAVCQGEPYILSVGRLADPRKNVRLLFEAYALLRNSYPAAPRLVVAGTNGPTATDLKYAASLGLAEHLSIEVNLTLPRLVALYQQAALFVLSSDEEGLGLVLLEAMACGLPVVSTNCGGPATAVIEGETGLLTPVGEARALADAMTRLLKDAALRERLGRAGRMRAEQAFSLDAAGCVYLRKYNELLD